MNTLQHFKCSRLRLLLKLELFKRKKALMLTFGITFGVLFVCTLLELIFSSNTVFKGHRESYVFNLLIGGFILSSLSFNDLGSALRKPHYLTLPASVFEKVLSMWLLTSVGWITAYTITFTLYAWLLNMVFGAIFSHVTYMPFQLSDTLVLQAIRYYFVLQGIFLVGAVHFKGYVLPKTLLTLLLALMVCLGIAYYTLADLFPFADMDSGCPPLAKGVSQIWGIAQWMFWWLLAPICWIITYFGLKEQEV